MTTFKEFLLEDKVKAWKVKDLSLKKIIKILNEECSDGLKAIQNNSLLFRGFQGGQSESSAYQFIDTAKAERTSRDTNNLYQLMMDSSVAFAKFPKRRNSLICATNIDTAEEYGTVRVIVPFNGTKVAALDKKYDLFAVDIKNGIFRGDGVEQLCADVDSILTDELGLKHFGRYTDIDKIDKFLSKFKIERIVNAFKQFIDVPEPKLKEIFNKAPNDKRFSYLASSQVTPEALTVGLYTYGDKLPAGNPDAGVEAWFSGKALSISVRTFCDILVTLEKEHNFAVPKELKRSLDERYLDAIERYKDAISKGNENDDI